MLMRVFMIAPTPFFSDRGCHVRIYEEIKALKKRGVEVFLFTYHHGRDMEGIDTYRIFNIPWYKKYDAGPSLHKFYVDPILLITCISKMKALNPDILHCHLHEGALIGIFCRMFKRIPVIFDMQGSLTDELRAHNFLRGNKTSLSIMKMIEKRIVNSVDIIISSSDACANFAIREFGVSKGKIKIIPDGIDMTMFKNESDKSRLRKKFNIPIHKKIVVYLGVLSKYQGVDLLLDAIYKISLSRKDIFFIIMGYPNVEYYKELSKRKGISELISFTGRVPYEKIPEYLSLGDIAVSPKFSETEANGKILNYMAAGLPTIVFDNPINRMILGDTGIYAMADSTSLAKEIITLLDSNKKMDELKKSLKKRVEEYFLWDKIAEKIIKIYENSQYIPS